MSHKISELLTEAAKALCCFLNRVLPSIGGANWWIERVADRLTYSQQRFVQQHNVTQLSELDLAALLRVLDQNWYEINHKLTFPPDTRHYLKEMQTVRNRWAHTSVQDYPPEDAYRDLDTLHRFLVAIDADEALLDSVREARGSLLKAEPQEHPTTDKPVAAGVASGSQDTKFAITQIVRLRPDPVKTGPVLAIQASAVEHRYHVFIDGAARWFYESQLEATAPQAIGPELVSLNRFHAHLTALQIQHPSLSTLYSLNAARVDFIPYQFRPVLKFIRADRPRLLVADGVGVGKTIEAGLILKELQARGEVSSVLIICPRPLVTERKWVVEIKRFEERFTQLDGMTLRYCLNETDLEGEWPEEHAKTIIPYSLFDEILLYGNTVNGGRRKKRQPGLLDLDPPPRFDLVIVDEAHHVRNPNTFSYEAVRFFCNNAKGRRFSDSHADSTGQRRPVRAAQSAASGPHH